MKYPGQANPNRRQAPDGNHQREGKGSLEWLRNGYGITIGGDAISSGIR